MNGRAGFPELAELVSREARDGVIGRVDDDGNAVEGHLEFVVGNVSSCASCSFILADAAPARGEVGLAIAETLESGSTIGSLDGDIDVGRLRKKRFGGCFQDR